MGTRPGVPSAGRAVVLGACGFVGSHIVSRLKAEGWWVRAVDVKHSDLRFEHYAQADEVVITDLRHSPTVASLVTGFDHVYNLAADHGGAGYFHSEHDQPAARNNMQIDLNVLRACEREEPRLFYASSFCAYPMEYQVDDGSGSLPYKLHESLLHTGQPEQCYGAEKRFMTLLCENAAFDARCGVFATIYGPGQEYEGIRAKFPTAITQRVLEAKRTGGPVEVWGDGSQIRTFLYVDDAVERIMRIMCSEHYDGPVNVASDQEVTVRQCADWACEAAGLDQNYRWNPDKPTGVAARTPDNSKFFHRYGDAPQLETREGFRRLHDWLAELEGARSLAA